MDKRSSSCSRAVLVIRIHRRRRAKAQTLREKAERVVAAIKNHGLVDTTATTELLQAINALQPKTGALYKGSKDFQVPLAAPAGD